MKKAEQRPVASNLGAGVHGVNVRKVRVSGGFGEPEHRDLGPHSLWAGGEF